MGPRFFLAFLAAALFSAAAAAQDEHRRRLAAELAVMAGDARRLASGSELAQHREGLQARLAGALSSLPLLLRHAGCIGPPPGPRPEGRGDGGSLRSLSDAAAGLGRPGAGCDAAAVPALRTALARRDWRALDAGLRILQRKYPLDLTGLLPAQATPERLRLGAAIHQQACAGCHEAPTMETRLPAFNLFEQAKRTPRTEFAARLLIGVRGDRSTAWRNPFSDLELGALMAYYEIGKSEKAARD